jgi:hypothetical protein
LRSSSIFFLGPLSSWVEIRLHTENQPPSMPGSALKVPVGWWVVVGFYPLSSLAPTPVEVELGCDNYSPGAYFEQINAVSNKTNLIVCHSSKVSILNFWKDPIRTSNEFIPSEQNENEYEDEDLDFFTPGVSDEEEDLIDHIN